jgi:hypothetical protein
MNDMTVPVQKRTEKRSRLLLKAIIEVDGEPRAVRVRDLSHTGAQLNCDEPPEVGSMITFKGRTVTAQARIAWVTGHVLGITFLEALSDGALHDEVGLTFRVSVPTAHQPCQADETSP